MAAKKKSGVLSGDSVSELFAYAQKKQFALPAVNVIGSSTVNAVMETAAALKSPVIIQFSNGGAAFNAGKGLPNKDQKAAIAGSIAGALHIHELAKEYGACVILHTDHCAKELLPWIDGVLDAGEKFYQTHGYPLFSSHMLDLSEEPIEENIEISKKYLARMSEIGMSLEIELGVTGGEEDGVDNTDVDSSRLYTQPEEVSYAYEELGKISDRFLIAAAFGNVHGVYKPGNVDSGYLEKLPGLRAKEILDCREADQICIPRRFGFEPGGNPRSHFIRCCEDEHRHGSAMGILERNSRLLRSEQRLPTRSNRKSRRRGQAEQEKIRSSRLGPRCGAVIYRPLENCV